MPLFPDDLSAERQLWQSFQQGDQNAYAQLYDRYFDVLYRYGKKITPDTFLVEDCIQDLFVSLWKNRETLSEFQSPRFYLYKSLRNRIVAQLKRTAVFLDDSAADTLKNPDASPSAEAAIIREETLLQRNEKMETALQHLSKREREAIFLKFYSGLNSTQISEVMGISLPSVYNLINRAISHLQHSLDKLLLLFFWLIFLG